MSTKLLSVLLSAAVAVGLTGACAASADAAASPVGITTIVSQNHTDVTLSCAFAGTDATAFLLAVPQDASLSSLKSAQIGRYLTVDALTGEKVHYRVAQASASSLLITLQHPQPGLELTFNLGLFSVTDAEAISIAGHTVTSLRMGIAFSGGPAQLMAAKFAIRV